MLIQIVLRYDNEKEKKKKEKNERESKRFDIFEIKFY